MANQTPVPRKMRDLMAERNAGSVSLKVKLSTCVGSVVSHDR